jgi:acetyl-CoA synthetase
MNTNDKLLDNNLSYPPQEEFAAQANLNLTNYQQLLKDSNADNEQFWVNLAQAKVSWQQPFTRGLNRDNAPFFKWFEDGRLNVSYNCIDRHLPTHANKPAIIFEADDGKVEKISYAELHRRVCKFANGLKALNIKKGDRIVIYMPHSIEAVVAMQSAVRIGAIHSVVFGGFSAKALAERVLDAQAKCIITVDGYIRGGKVIELKPAVDEAITYLHQANYELAHVVVEKRINNPCNMTAYRDIWFSDFLANQSEECQPEWVEAEHPLFILYTSGSTGKPKGVQHATGGYLLGTIVTMEWVFDYKASDCYWCTADVGWITGHSYVCYGPLAVGATQIIFEGIPTYPDAGRFWQIIEKHQVSVFYTAPTAIRNLIKLAADLPNNYNLSSLRLLGTVGEPINPEAWKWYYEVVGRNNCPIVDTWWQTETGCNVLSPVAGVTALKPGSCIGALPGFMVSVVDEAGNEIKHGGSGYLVIKQPFPSQLRTIWGDAKRFKDSYYKSDIAGGKYYVAGDSAQVDEDGYLWILGRIDDVLNVSGHRLGTMEIESAIAMHSSVAEAAVVGIPHEIKGEAVCAFVVCKKGVVLTATNRATICDEIRAIVTREIGAIAKPDEIRFGDGLPKTRSGKIMRRLLRSIAKGEPITQDISTLENPQIIEQLQQGN